MYDSELDSSGGFKGDPPYAGPVGDPFADQLTALYAEFGRTPTPQEIESHRGNPGGLDAIRKLLEHDQPAPTPTVTGGGGGGTGGYDGGGNNTIPLGQGLLAPFQGTPPAAPGTGTPYIPQTPNYTAPTFTPPAYKPPPAFNLPSPQEAMNDPGYQFTLGQGQKGLEQSAAARGLLNTGGTAKDLIGYNQAAATTQYGNVLNRMLNQYLTNYQTQYVDPNAISFRDAQASFAPQMAQFNANVGAGNLGYSTQAASGQRAHEFNYNALMDQYLQGINNFRDQRDSTFNKTFSYLTAE